MGPTVINLNVKPPITPNTTCLAHEWLTLTMKFQLLPISSKLLLISQFGLLRIKWTELAPLSLSQLAFLKYPPFLPLINHFSLHFVHELPEMQYPNK